MAATPAIEPLLFTINYLLFTTNEAQWPRLISTALKLQFSRDRSHKSFAGLFRRGSIHD